MEDWIDSVHPASPTATPYGTESPTETETAEAEPRVVDPRVIKDFVAAAEDAHLFLRTDTKPFPVQSQAEPVVVTEADYTGSLIDTQPINLPQSSGEL